MENVIQDNVTLGKDVELGLNCVLGLKRKRLNVKYPRDESEERRGLWPVSIGARSVLRNYVLIYEGVTLGEDTFVDDFVRVGARTTVGDGSMLLYGAHLMERVEIGTNCRIAGFIPDDVKMGNDVTMMGTIAHKYDRPLNWSRTEPSPTLGNDVVVGLGSVIVGPIHIGDGAYVAAGAIVTKDVPSHTVVINTNQMLSVPEFAARKGRIDQG